MSSTCFVLLAATAFGQTSNVLHDATITDQLVYPARLAATGSGGLYVTDQISAKVTEYDAAGLFVATYGIPEQPVGIAVIPGSGNVVVSRRDGLVGVYDAAFNEQSLLDPLPFAMIAPNDIAVHPGTEEIYVADSEAHQVMVFSPLDGTLLRMWGMEGTGLAEFESPQAIALDPILEHVIVADLDNFRVQVFTPQGLLLYKFGYRTLFTGGTEVAWLARTEGLAVDMCSNIYLADALMGTVRVFSSTGTEIDPGFTPVVQYGTGPGQVRLPMDVLIDANDKMYLTSAANSAVEVYDVGCTSLLTQLVMGPAPLIRSFAPRATLRRPARPVYPDNPAVIAESIMAGEYNRRFDYNNDRVVDREDLAIVVEDFGAGSVDQFMEIAAGTLDAYPTPLQPPHMIEQLPNLCGRCHAMDGLPNGMLTSEGQENLCLSCHSGAARAMGTPITSQGPNHPYGVAADSGGVNGPAPESELALHLDNGNVRCATCHDPHEQDNGEPYLRNTIGDAALCGECHIESEQWYNAGHSDETSTAFTYPVGPGRESCATCHSGLGFIDYAAGVPQEDLRTDMQVISCFVCHDVHGEANEDLLRIYGEVVLPGDIVVTDAEENATCMTCHNGRRAPDDGGTPHYALAGVMLEGVNGIDFGATLMNSAHTEVSSCVKCHMAPTPADGQPGARKVGWHSFNIIVHDPEDPDFGFENVDNACNAVACHGATGPLTTVNRTAYGDYDGNGSVEGVQDEVQGLMDLVFHQITTNGAVFLGHYPYWNYDNVDSNSLELVQDVVWNWEYVDNSGDLGVHNTGYAVGLLQVSYEQLAGEPVSGAELRYLPPGLSATVVDITEVNGGVPVEAGGAFTVDFTIEDDLGDPIAMEDLNRLRLYVSGPTENYQRVIEQDGDLANFVQNPDGSYTYTAPDPFPAVYAPPVNDSPAFGPGDGEMTGDPLLEGTYTVLIESRRVFGSIRKAGDATMDFVIADDPGLPPALAPREYVLQEDCNACHLDLQIHGSNRFTVRGCRVCHTAGAEDRITSPETTLGVTIEFGDLIHKLHRGHDLAFVTATENATSNGGPYRYEVIGFGESVHDFSDVGFPILPGGITDCNVCHGNAAQGALIHTTPTRASCGGCHDDIDFVTGTILDRANTAVDDGLLGVDDLDDPLYRAFPGGTFDHTAAADNFCASCHGAGAPWDTEPLHQHPTALTREGTGLAVEIVSVEGMTGGGGLYFVPGDLPEVTFRLTDTNGPVQLVPGDSSVVDRLEVVVSGPTTLYQTIIESQRPWSGANLAVPPANWIDDFGATGTYTFISEDPIPTFYPAQLNTIGEPPAEQVFPFEEGWGQQYTAVGTPLDAGTYTVTMYGRRVTPIAGEREPAVTDTFDVALGADEAIVPYDGTVTTESCNACHGNLAFHGNQREGVESCLACHTAGTQDGGTLESVDFRIMLHKLHNARNLDVVQQGGAYELNGFFGIADFSQLLISAMPGEAAECAACHVDDDWKVPSQRSIMQTWKVVCTSCHDSAATATHAEEQSEPGTFVEYCVNCHGPGAPFDVELVHANP